MNQASDAVKNIDTKKLVDQAQQWYGSAKPYIADAAKKSSTLTRKYPLQAVLGAICLGFLASIFLRRRV